MNSALVDLATVLPGVTTRQTSSNSTTTETTTSSSTTSSSSSSNTCDFCGTQGSCGCYQPLGDSYSVTVQAVDTTRELYASCRTPEFSKADCLYSPNNVPTPIVIPDTQEN